MHVQKNAFISVETWFMGRFVQRCTNYVLHLWKTLKSYVSKTFIRVSSFIKRCLLNYMFSVSGQIKAMYKSAASIPHHSRRTQPKVKRLNNERFLKRGESLATIKVQLSVLKLLTSAWVTRAWVTCAWVMYSTLPR